MEDLKNIYNSMIVFFKIYINSKDIKCNQAKTKFVTKL